MRTELVSIPTDTFPLEGAYYEPEEGEIVGAAMLSHGNCMNFYVGAPRFLPPVLTKLGLACLAFNRRGHDVLSSRDSRELEGGAYQTTAEAVADSRYAAQWLSEQGHDAPIVIGHSNGGMLSVQHVADHPETPALVLLSAHVGGPSIARLASKAGLWAADQFDDVEKRARDLVASGRPRELMLLPGWWKVTSAESALDYLSEVPDILALAPKISCPVLYLRGDEEPADIYPAERFQALCTGPCDFEVIEACGHFYVGREEVVSETVARWLEKILSAGPP